MGSRTAGMRIEDRASRAFLDPSMLVPLVLLALSACATRPVRLVVVSSSLAQTISLLGDTLYGVSLSGAGGPERVRNITAAREALARDSMDLNARLRLARSTAELGRLREAVELYSRIAEAHFQDPRVFRERGEALLRLRHLDAAIADLRRAGLLAIGRNAILEAAPVEEVPEAGPVIFTTVQFRIFFFQGVALFCKGDYAAAYPVLAEAIRIAPTTDDLARAMLWLFFAARRMGDGAEGANVLGLVKPEWIENSEVPELELLLAFKGLIPTDSIREHAWNRPDESGAIYRYGIAYFMQLRPDRRPDAELWLEQTRSGSNWAALPYLAAEADLARLRGVKKPIR